MPLRKHNGDSLRCIYRQYLIWCLSQPWFRTKFGTLFDIHRGDVSSRPVNDGCKNNIYNFFTQFVVVVVCFGKKQCNI
jgi:hypothetical protein